MLALDTAINQPITFPHDQRARGTYILGLNGTGKTTLIESMVVQDIQAGHGLCLLDPHGDLTDAVLARIPAEREADVILWDITDGDYPFGMNLYACQDPQNTKLRALLVDQIIQTFEKVWGKVSWGPRIEYVLRNTAQTLLANPGMTMAEIPKLLTNADFRARLVANVRNPLIRLFWERYERKKLPDQDDFTESTLNKLDEFLSQELLYHIVGQSATAINFREVMDTGKILLVRLDAQLEHITKLVGSVVVGQMLSAALSRADTRQRRPFFLYADEYHFFATPSFAHLIDQARKYNVATVIAHQRRDQLDAEHRKAPLGAANLVVFKVLGADAQELALEFKATPQPSEVVWKPIIEQAYEEWSEWIWDPPEAEQEYDAVSRQLSVLAKPDQPYPDSRSILWKIFHLSYEGVESQIAQGEQGILHLSRPFYPWRHISSWESRLPHLGMPKAEMITQAIDDQRGVHLGYFRNYVRGEEPDYYHKVVAPGRFTKGGEICLKPDADGRSYYRWLPSLTSYIEDELRLHNTPVAQQLLAEVQPLLAPHKGTAILWFKPGWPQDDIVLRASGTALDNTIYDTRDEYFKRGEWEIPPLPEVVAWLRDKVAHWQQRDQQQAQANHEQFTRTKAGLEARQAALRACKKEVWYREPLGYGMVVKAGTGIYRSFGRSGLEELEDTTYRREAGSDETIANARNRIADALASLPQFHAKVKLGNVEHLITTRKLPEVAWTRETETKIRRIRTKSQRTYGKSVDKVIKEIEHRQESAGAILSPPAYANDIPPNRAETDEEENLSDERAW